MVPLLLNKYSHHGPAWGNSHLRIFETEKEDEVQVLSCLTTCRWEKEHVFQIGSCLQICCRRKIPLLSVFVLCIFSGCSQFFDNMCFSRLLC